MFPLFKNFVTNLLAQFWHHHARKHLQYNNCYLERCLKCSEISGFLEIPEICSIALVLNMLPIPLKVNVTSCLEASTGFKIFNKCQTSLNTTITKFKYLQFENCFSFFIFVETYYILLRTWDSKLARCFQKYLNQFSFVFALICISHLYIKITFVIIKTVNLCLHNFVSWVLNKIYRYSPCEKNFFYSF